MWFFATLCLKSAATPQASRDPNGDVQKRRALHGPIRSGILFMADDVAVLGNIRFEHLTVRNCIFSGVYIYGVEGSWTLADAISPGMAVRLLLRPRQESQPRARPCFQGVHHWLAALRFHVRQWRSRNQCGA